jgi:ankyrin repeat protein
VIVFSTTPSTQAGSFCLQLKCGGSEHKRAILVRLQDTGELARHAGPPQQLLLLQLLLQARYGTLICDAVLVLQDGYAPLHKAAENGHLEVVGLLLGASAALDAANNKVRPPVGHPYRDRCLQQVQSACIFNRGGGKQLGEFGRLTG